MMSKNKKVVPVLLIIFILLLIFGKFALAGSVPFYIYPEHEGDFNPQQLTEWAVIDTEACPMDRALHAHVKLAKFPGSRLRIVYVMVGHEREGDYFYVISYWFKKNGFAWYYEVDGYRYKLISKIKIEETR